MTVAGPDRSGSGRGVPVPNITIWVAEIESGLPVCWYGSEDVTCTPQQNTNSLGNDLRCLDDDLPLRGGGLEPGFGFGTAASNGFELLHAEARLNVDRFEGLQHLVFQDGANRCRSFGWCQHH